jgi:hypothetical protein
MRVPVAALVVVLVWLLAGCSDPVPGSGSVTPDDRARAGRLAVEQAAVDGAVQALSAQNAVAYRISAKDVTGNPLGLTLQVTRNGTVLGSFPAAGQEVKVLRVDGKPYLSAPASYWQSQRVEPGKAAEYATRWVRADPTLLPLDPGAVLTPSAAADALRASLATMDHGAEPVRKLLPDGTEVFDLNAGPGRLQVTTAQPYRVVSAEPTLFGGVVGQTFGVGGSVAPEGLAGPALDDFGGRARTEVAAIGQPLAVSPPVRTTVQNKRLNCENSGSCTETVRVGNTVGGDVAGKSVRIALRSMVTAQGLGEQHCDQEITAAPNSTSELSCTVRFALPRTAGSAQVVAVPSVSGDVLVPVDAPALAGLVRSEFQRLAG